MTRTRLDTVFDDSEGLLNSSFFRLVTKMVFGVALAIVVLTLAQCTVRKPESPTWDTRLTVPLMHRTYHMDELIQRMGQEGVKVVNDTVQYSISYTLDTVALNADNLSTPNLSYDFSKQLGLISLTPPTITPTTIDASTIQALSLAIPGVVPPLDFAVTSNLPVIASYSSATISSGQAYVVVTNNLGVPLNTVAIQVYDITRGVTIDNRSFPTAIPSGGTDSVLVNLNGKVVSNSLRVVANCHTNGGTVLSAAGLGMTTDVHFGSVFTVSSATAQVPALTRADSQTIALAESSVITDAVIAAGTLQMTFSNRSNLSADINVTLPQLLLSGIPLIITQTVAANSSQPISRNLAGFHLTPLGNTVPQSVKLRSNVFIAGSGTTLVSVNQSDNFQVTASLNGVRFNAVTGLFSSTEAAIPSYKEAIDVPKGFDAFRLTRASLEIDITNGVELPGSLDITVTGNNGKPPLHIQHSVASGSSTADSITHIVRADVADFLSPIPDTVTVTGLATFGGNGTSGTIREGDFVVAKVTFRAPLEMVISDSSVFDTDPARTTIEQKDISKVTDHFNSAVLSYTIDNHLPLGAKLELCFGSDSTTLYTNPELQKRVEVLSPFLASGTQPTPFTLELTNADIQILKHPVLFIGQRIMLSGNGANAIRLTPTDSITISGFMEVNYRFSGQW